MFLLIDLELYFESSFFLIKILKTGYGSESTFIVSYNDIKLVKNKNTELCFQEHLKQLLSGKGLRVKDLKKTETRCANKSTNPKTTSVVSSGPSATSHCDNYNSFSNLSVKTFPSINQKFTSN